MLTIQEEFGNLKNASVTFVGDGNNVARSSAIACRRLGANFTLSAPTGYDFSDDFIESLDSLDGDGTIQRISDPVEAVRGTNAVYTDVWASMGQEKDQKKREQDFAGHQVNAALMAHAPEAIFLHCLPAKRGQEVTSDVIDGQQSRIVEQAANRMHAQKAVLAWLLRT